MGKPKVTYSAREKKVWVVASVEDIPRVIEMLRAYEAVLIKTPKDRRERLTLVKDAPPL